MLWQFWEGGGGKELLQALVFFAEEKSSPNLAFLTPVILRRRTWRYHTVTMIGYLPPLPSTPECSQHHELLLTKICNWWEQTGRLSWEVEESVIQLGVLLLVFWEILMQRYGWPSKRSKEFENLDWGSEGAVKKRAIFEASLIASNVERLVANFSCITVLQENM